MTKKLLVTGYGGYPHHKTNPSYDALLPLPGTYGDVEMVVRHVQTQYGEDGGGQAADKIAREIGADAILSFGVYSTQRNVRVEQFGWNHAGDYPDVQKVKINGYLNNAPQAKVGEPATVDCSAFASYISSEGIQGVLSEDPLDYLCNAMAYWHGAGEYTKNIPHLFCHVPAYTDRLFGKQSWKVGHPIKTLTKTLALAVEYMCLNHLGAERDSTFMGRIAAPESDLAPQLNEAPKNWFASLPVCTIGVVTHGILGMPHIDEMIPTKDTDLLKDVGRPGRWEKIVGTKFLKVTRKEKGASEETPVPTYICRNRLYYTDKISIFGHTGFEDNKIYEVTFEYYDAAAEKQTKTFELDLTGSKARYTDVTN